MKIQPNTFEDDMDYYDEPEEHHDEYEKYRIATQEELDKYFLNMCVYLRFDHMKYVLTSPELKIHANVHTEEDLGFAHLVGNKDKGREIVQYLIFDFNLEKTEIIEGMFNYDESSVGKDVLDILQEYKRMFETRELNKTLNTELPGSDAKEVRKPKV